MSFFDVAVQVWPMLMEGLVVTVEVTIISLAIASVLGMSSCLMGMSVIKPVSWLSKLYVWIIRGTPFIVQLFIIYFGIPQILAQMGVMIRITSFEAAAATLALNAGAYMSEIFRGGIQAVDKGQMEAARSLGLSKGKTMLKIILPQALRISIPALGNQCIITLKDSSLAQVIALAEIVYMGKIFVGRTMQSFYTYLLIGIVYLIIISILQIILARIERRMSYGA